MDKPSFNSKQHTHPLFISFSGNLQKNSGCAIKVGVANLGRIINNHIKENVGDGIIV